MPCRGGTSSELPIGGAKNLYCPSREYRDKPPLSYSSEKYRGKSSKRILSLPIGEVRKLYFPSREHRGKPLRILFAMR